MLVIDTNVASDLMRPTPTPSVAAWIAERDAGTMFLTAISEAELRFGVAILPAGRRRNALEVAMRGWLERGFGDRILPFDSAAAQAYAEIAAERRQAGVESAKPIARLPPYRARAEPASLRETSGTSKVRESRSSIPGRRNDLHDAHLASPRNP